MFAVTLLGARAFGAHFMAFFQNDEVSLAAGVAAVMSGPVGDVYRFGPQLGYYRLVEGVDLLLGGNLRAIPLIMIWLSVLAGTLIPVCGLYLFPDLLSVTERKVLAGVLALNPIVWMSSAYGNSAMPSLALLVLAITMLSRRPGRLTEAAALFAFAAAVLVRADAVLASPVVAVVLHQRYRSVRAVAARCATLAIGIAAVYVVAFLTDPRMASTVDAVTSHLTNARFTTKFWDYLLWSTSPFLLLFAAIGLRDLVADRRALLTALGAWALPFFAFYYAATTSPRYFVPTAVPVAVASAVGLVALVPLMAPLKRSLAVAVLAVLATAHLFVGLGHFTPGSPKHLLTQAQFETQVGPLWTGAFLYQSYCVPGFLVRSVRHPGFGALNGTEHALDEDLTVVASGADSGRTIVVLLAGWKGHVFHYYAPVHGARYVSRAAGPVYATETWMTLGGARIMSIAQRDSALLAMRALPVAPGDEAWAVEHDEDSDSLIEDRLPPGLRAVAIGDTTARVRRYRLVTTRGPS